MATKLEIAVQIFTDLGWEEANINEVYEISIGTKEQQRIAREGLKSGEWYKFQEIGKNTYGAVPLVDVDLEKLALFAIRVGVDAKRAVNILKRSSKTSFQVISGRGEKYVSDFIQHECRSNRRMFEHSPTVFGELCVYLLHQMELKIPQNVEYIKNWAVYTSHAMGLKVELRYDEELQFKMDLEFLKERFKEHIEVGISLGAPATGPFYAVFLEGVKRGFLSRDEALEWVFFALDSSVRPADRKAWCRVLDEISVEDEEILSRIENIISLLSFGDGFLIERFAPLLISKCSDEVLPRVLISSFSCKGKKMRQIVLKAALKRESPKCDENLCEWIHLLESDEDVKISNSAKKIIKAWGIDVPVSELEKDDGIPTNDGICGLWRSTPDLWKVPVFDLSRYVHQPFEVLKAMYEKASSPIGSDALSRLVVENAGRKADVCDLASERLLALSNLIARIDEKGAKSVLSGMKNFDVSLNSTLGLWARGKDILSPIDREEIFYYGEEERRRKSYTSLIYARNLLFVKNLGKMPCILSTPSFDDLSICFEDLIDRLLKYIQEGVEFVYEADLQLALARLDVGSAKKEDIKRLSEIKLLIKLPDGENLTHADKKGKNCLSVADVILQYLKAPFVEPDDYYEDISKYWGYRVEMGYPKSLEDFPNRLSYACGDFYAIFPFFGDFALSCIMREDEVYHGQGLILRQCARRRSPFPKAASLNVLALQSNLSDENAQDVIEGTLEAWERGLLQVGIADVKYLDWNISSPSNLASLSKSLDDIAQDGMLSVVWQVIDDMVSLSLAQQRMLSGTAELVKLAKKYIREVLHAIKSGLTDESVLNLAGIRALAKKSSSSIAVTSARELLFILEQEGFGEDRLQEKNRQKSDGISAKSKEKSANLSMVSSEEYGIKVPEIPFETFWKSYPKEEEILEDDVSMQINSLKISASKRALVFDLKLADMDEHIYKVLLYDWVYSLQEEGQVSAIRCPVEALQYGKDEKMQREYLDGKERVWLYYDENTHKMKLSEYRNFNAKNNSPSDVAHPLSVSLLMISLALVVQDGDCIYSALRLIRGFVQSGKIGVLMTKMAMEKLLKYEDVNPAKLVRVLEQENELFSALYPILTMSIAHGGGQVLQNRKVPVWVNRVLDVCLHYAFYLKEAMKRGEIPKEDANWEGLKEIANCKAKSTAVSKARALLEYFEGWQK